MQFNNIDVILTTNTFSVASEIYYKMKIVFQYALLVQNEGKSRCCLQTIIDFNAACRQLPIVTGAEVSLNEFAVRSPPRIGMKRVLTVKRAPNSVSSQPFRQSHHMQYCIRLAFDRRKCFCCACDSKMLTII